MGIGVVILAVIVFFGFFTTKGAHLELTGKVLKVRTAELDERSSVAVLDIRVQDPSDIPFVTREVKVTLVQANGEKVNGFLVSKVDVAPLFQYNRFLGTAYNDTLSIKDKVPAHGQIDRMVAARFDLPIKDLDAGKSLDLWIQDMDGAEFETSTKIH